VKVDLSKSEYFSNVKKDLVVCNSVKTTLETEGWKNVIKPLIDKAIIDVLGGQIDGRWVSGLIDRAKKDERREFYIGYKQALVDLDMRINNYIDQIVLKEDELKRVLAEEERFIGPYENSPYKGK